MRVSYKDFERRDIPDSDADTSYLEQEGFEDRLAEYKRDGFGSMGIRAVVSIPVAGIIQTFESAGLWGIEDDSDADYLASVFAEECAQLVDILEELGIEVTDKPSVEA